MSQRVQELYSRLCLREGVDASLQDGVEIRSKSVDQLSSSGLEAFATFVFPPDIILSHLFRVTEVQVKLSEHLKGGIGAVITRQ